MFNGIASFIYKMFGFDVDVYNKFASKSDQYIFKSENKIYLWFKFGTFGFIFSSAILFMYLASISSLSPFLMYPYIDENSLKFGNFSDPEGMGDLMGRAWIYIVFAVIYSFAAIRLWKVLWGLRKQNSVQRANSLYSFNYIFFLTSWIIMIIRFSLYFSLDDMQLYMNPHVFAETYSKNKLVQEYILRPHVVALDSYVNYQTQAVAILVGYYWVVILTILNIICVTVLFIIKPRLKDDVKEKFIEAQKKYVSVIKTTMNSSVDDLIVFLPKSILPVNANGKLNLENNEKVVLDGIIKDDKKDNKKVLQFVDFHTIKQGIMVAPDKTKKSKLIKPDKAYYDSINDKNKINYEEVDITKKVNNLKFQDKLFNRYNKNPDSLTTYNMQYSIDKKKKDKNDNE